MATQRKVLEKTKNNYFADIENKDLDFFSSGCTLLDCSLGGGYPVGRMINIVGDKSSGKTGNAMEAIINFKHKFPNSEIYYWESEAAFDKSYAKAMGVPVDLITFVDTSDNTIEAVFEHLEIVNKNENKVPILYIIDSLDALSDRAEKDRDIDQGTFAMNKQKINSQIFRRKIKDFEKSNITLMIISQVRENIGVTFGDKYSRSGGKAMDFYASQIIWLAETGKIKKTINGIERVIGLNVRTNCKKNKVGLPFRQIDYPYIFGWGIDDISASLQWLEKVKSLDGLEEFLDGKSKIDERIIKKIKDKMKESKDEKNRIQKLIDELVIKKWIEIETLFLPTESKYV